MHLEHFKSFGEASLDDIRFQSNGSGTGPATFSVESEVSKNSFISNMTIMITIL